MLACLLLLLPAAALAQQPCDGGGDPGGCEGGVASQSGGAGGGVPVGSTTPIHFFTGNKYLREVDLPALPGPLGLEIVRHYNSQDAARAGLTGRGWRLSYETDLKVEGRLIQITQADGRRIPFVQDRQDPSRFRHADPLRGEIRREGAGYAARYRWHWPDGRLLTFNGLGQLEEIRLASGEFLRLTYGPAHELVSVIDPQGRSLILRWAGKGEAWRGITALATPVGVFRYEHAQDGAQRGTLTQVRAPDGAVARDYHYEDARHPGHLTGITLKGTDTAGGPLLQRLATYTYDAQGRAVSTAQGEGTAGLRLTYVTEGHTRVENALGLTSDYRGEVLGGEWRLLEARGPGCAACPAADRRYEWDTQGRLIGRIELDAAGHPRTRTGFLRDGQGRVVELTRQVRQAARWSTPQRLARYAFEAEALQPSLIARPSVVAGREHTVRLTYNATGQPVEVTEHGWRPALGTEGPQPLARTLRFAYGTVNAASLPVALDGPLPNGTAVRPADSDVTVREYDPQTRLLQAVTTPGGETTRVIERDAAKRPTVIRKSDGMRLIETRLAYTYYGAPTRIEEFAWILQDGKGDPASRQRRLTTLAYDPQRALTRVERQGVALTIERDATGAPTTLIDTEGNRIALRFDAEGRLLAWALFDAQGQRLDGRLNLWDENGGLRARLTPLGLAFAQGPTEATDTLVRIDAQGGVSALAAAAPGRLEWLAPDGAARRLRVARGGAALVDAAGRAHLRLHDDFGRPVLEADPDEGRLEYRYGDTYIEKRQTGRGGETAGETLRFDVAGRLVTRQRGGCTERLHYEGGLLARLDGCGNTHTFARDAFGLITAHTEAFVQADGGTLRFASAYVYEDGRLAARTLPDGQVLRYRHDPVSGNPAAVSREAGWLAGLRRHLGAGPADWAHRLLPAAWTESTLLAEVRHRPFGPVTGFTHANGLATTTEFDAAGRVQALRVGEGRAPIEALDYQWSATSRISALTRNGAARHYRYDAAGRLVEEAPAAQAMPVRYAYTPLGARRAALPARDGFGRQQTLGSRTLHYDAAHRLVEVREAETSVARYTYDALGNRIAKTAGGRTTYFLYDLQHRLVAEADAAGHIEAQYLYLDHRPYALLRAEGQAQTRSVYAVHTDARGLPLAVTDSARKVVWRGEFSAYGAALGAPGGFAFPLRLAGQYADAETGLYYNIHRYYDPARGEYLTPDPLGLADSDNRYGYVGGDPLGGIDPLGLFEIPIGALNGNDYYFVDMKVGTSDGGHGDILRAAFWLYQKKNPSRFSQAIIDQIIVNNYLSDAENKANGCLPGIAGADGGGQCQYTNHFDNPNAGAGAPYELKKVINPVTGKITYVNSGEFRPGYTNTNWIQDGIDDLNAYRSHYGDFEDHGAAGVDISQTLDAFGRNSHALADFYAHSNWVDGPERGGCWSKIPLVGTQQRGWVPVGLDKRVLWGEASFPDLYSGTVGWTELKGTFDKSTHSYWHKDGDDEQTDEKPYSEDEQNTFNAAKMFYWTVAEYDPGKHKEGSYMTGKVNGWESANGLGPKTGLKKGDLIYVALPITNRHRMATYLAVQHTLNEIDKLWAAAAGKTLGGTGLSLQDAFRLGKDELSSAGVAYQALWPKDQRP